jgi:hypothetical protein
VAGFILCGGARRKTKGKSKEVIMSEYQYYEFLALDKPLSAEAIAEVRALSSRVQPTPTQVVFNYSYGNFRGEPLDLLAKHYDIMLYIANWGSKQLAFRFPKAAIDLQALQPYYYGAEEIELIATEQHVILNFAFLEGESLGWIEGEGLLGPLVPLRDAILRGDLRALYLAWLHSAQRITGGVFEDEESDDPIEPPLPPGLKQLDAPLQALIEFFEIGQDLVDAAATTSPALKPTSEPLERWVDLLPFAERQRFLVRAARGEPIGAELLQRLRQLGGEQRPASVPAAEPRSFSAIVAAAEEVRRQRRVREQQAAERARQARFDALAEREEQVWAQIPDLLAQRKASGYEQAVAHLVDLRDLAIHRKQRAAFNERLKELLKLYPPTPALQRRLDEHKLIA